MSVQSVSARSNMNQSMNNGNPQSANPSVSVVETKRTNEQSNNQIASAESQKSNSNNQESLSYKQPTAEELENITEQLNNLMLSMNNDIAFALHEDTKTLMVRVEDSKTHKIIREVPSGEFLDMVVKIRDCIGALVDKNA